jgi:hypothetical protein
MSLKPTFSGVELKTDNYASLRYQYATTINAIAINNVPEESNCTITTGFTGVPSSQFREANIPWVTPVAPLFILACGFPVLGLPDAGLKTSFFVTITCHMADWWSEVQISNPAGNGSHEGEKLLFHYEWALLDIFLTVLPQKYNTTLGLANQSLLLCHHTLLYQFLPKAERKWAVNHQQCSSSKRVRVKAATHEILPPLFMTAVALLPPRC